MLFESGDLMDYTYIVTPLVGAGIGYCTNWIAIKMLFKPYTEKRMFGIKVPFTPGLIPKERDRIALAMGEVIENYLLTEDVIIKELTSEKIEKTIIDFVCEKSSDESKEQLATKINNHIDESKSVKELLGNDIIDQIKNLISHNEDRIKVSVIDLLNNVEFSHKVKKVISQVIAKKFGALGSMFANTDSIYEQIVISVKEQIDDVELAIAINNFLDKGFDKQLLEVIPKDSRKMIISSLIEKSAEILVNNTDENNKPLVLQLYDNVVKQYIVKMIKDADISHIIEKQINSFEINILEEMLLSIVNKELRAITLLGGLLGFIMSIIILLV